MNVRTIVYGMSKELVMLHIHVCTVIRGIFVVKQFSYSSKIMKIKQMKYFQRTYYVIEREFNYRSVEKIFNTNILHTNIFNTKFSKLRYMYVFINFRRIGSGVTYVYDETRLVLSLGLFNTYSGEGGSNP